MANLLEKEYFNWKEKEYYANNAIKNEDYFF